MKRLILVFSFLITAIGLGAPQRQQNPFDAGRAAYEAGQYEKALDFLSEVVRAGDTKNRNRALYFQGMSFFEMGYYYSAFTSFEKILKNADRGQKEVYEKAIKNSVLIADKLGLTDHLGKTISSFPSDLIPPNVMSIAQYAMAVYYASANRENDALGYLKSVTPDSPYYPKALFHLGILSTKKKDYNEATFYFGKAVAVTKGKRQWIPLREISQLNLARTLYSAKQTEKSIEAYAQFMSSSPYWITVLLEASWPLLKANDTTVSLGNLHTVLSPFYREDMVSEAYIVRSTLLYTLCKYEEMRKTLALFFQIYDPIVQKMQAESGRLGSPESFYKAFTTKELNPSFMNFAIRDNGIRFNMKVMDLLRKEKRELSKYSKRNVSIPPLMETIDREETRLANEIGSALQAMHKKKLSDLLEHREQANYLKVEIATGEKELVEGQQGLPPKRVVDVETTVSDDYRFWPFIGEYWQDELGAYVYTSESSCIR